MSEFVTICSKPQKLLNILLENGALNHRTPENEGQIWDDFSLNSKTLSVSHQVQFFSIFGASCWHEFCGTWGTRVLGLGYLYSGYGTRTPGRSGFSLQGSGFSAVINVFSYPSMEFACQRFMPRTRYSCTRIPELHMAHKNNIKL